ncbi:MAG: hypothetical protein LBK06_10295 [Planctomycetaceae bacterium]|jgi:hypothetical protein|nr:hypothetical protein [Planctomycetaceae bacterium]
MKRIFIFFLLLFIVRGDDTVYCEVTQNNQKLRLKAEDLNKFTLDELAEFIVSKKIYDPVIFGIDMDSADFQVSDLQSVGSRQVNRLDKEFKEVEITIQGLLSQKSPPNTKTVVSERKRVAFDLIRMQEFYKKVLAEKPKYQFDESVFYYDPFFDDLFNEEFFRLIALSVESEFKSKELTTEEKRELENFNKKLKTRQEAKKKNTLLSIEIGFTHDLIRQQKETVTKSHDYLVKLYSLEPRADDELLELFSKSKYAETEKVKILMELKIPYKNFRYWESQNRKFRTVAQFVSFDKSTNKVTLEKPNGKKTVARLHKLRYEDIKYVREQTTPPTTTVQPKP